MLDHKKFTIFGLTEKEAKVYVTLLELGVSFVTDIAHTSNVNRSSVYVILEELLNKGLVSICEEKNKIQYKAEPPERLIQMLEMRANDTMKAVEEARKILPQLKSLYTGVGVKPRVSFYEGEKGLISVYEDTLSSKETIRAYASIENMHLALKEYFPAYYQRRAAKGIHIRSVHPDTPEARERVTHDNEEARDSALVPHEEYDFSPEINIYDNKIVFMSLREKFGLIIESEELATAMKKIFELSWKEAKRLNDQIRRR